MTQGDAQVGKRAEFVHTTIGIISFKEKVYNDVQEVLTDLININNLAKINNQSNYLIERAKISATDAVIHRDYNNKILIIEKDESIKILLKTVLTFQGYEIQTISDFKQINPEYLPAVIILDAGSNETRSGLSVCKIIKESPLLSNSKLIVTSVFHEKETILKAGADLYIPKPYDIASITKWIEILTKEFNF